MKKIETSAAPAAIGPYSQGIKIGNVVYCSGQIPVDPATGTVAGTAVSYTHLDGAVCVPESQKTGKPSEQGCVFSGYYR